MKKRLFDELVESIKEAGQIHRGERPAREFVVDDGLPPASQHPAERRGGEDARRASRRGRQRAGA